LIELVQTQRDEDLDAGQKSEIHAMMKTPRGTGFRGCLWLPVLQKLAVAE
jgi:hypothetical protein